MQVELRTQIMLAREAEKQDRVRQQQRDREADTREPGPGAGTALFRGLRYACSRERGRPLK